VTSRGSWKLAGLGFVADPINDNHGAMVILVTIFVKIFGDITFVEVYRKTFEVTGKQQQK